MRSSFPRLSQTIAPCLAAIMALSLTDAAWAQQTAPPAAQARQVGASPGAPQPLLPDDPGAGPNAGPDARQDAVPAQQTGNQQAAAPASKPDQQGSAPVPVGAAAAPVIRSGGVPASRPAGAAIAPAKQRRARSYAIRVGLIVGAAVAVGAVTAASLSSSSRPH